MCQKPLCPNFSHFRYRYVLGLFVAVALSSSDYITIRYVLSVLWMTLCFPIMELVGQNQRQRYISSISSGGGTGAKYAVNHCLV